MKIQRMKTNRIVNPLGFDLKTPHVSWTVTDTEAKKQLWARVEVSKTEDFADVIFDTGACKTASSLGVPVEIALEPRTRYFWRVTVMGDNGELVTSDTAWFETAKLDEPFTAQRISPCLAPDTAPYMRRAFEIPGEVLSARAYFTGLGIYELYLNGEKANDEYLAPGCTAYDSWIQYQTYDVTDLIHTGENVIGAILGNGWAKGRFGFDGVVGDYETNFPGKPCNMYTEEYLLFGELHVTTTQGETVIVTDESWQCAPNPLTFGNIYDGERYDANLEIENWCAPSCTYANWQPVKRNTTTNLGAISARLSLPVKAKHIITPKQITTPKNELVFDLGQNITGWFTFMADLPAGVELRVQTGELLQDDCFYRDNLRTALSEYRYISTGKKAFIRPIATFYGFRYIKFSGVADLTGITDIQAWALYSDLEQTGEITTANEKVNRLYLNSVWSQRDNFLDVPTDCPQRDERMGWTGDAQAFCPTANYNMDCGAFYTKYIRDLLEEQKRLDGKVPDVAPLLISRKPGEANPMLGLRGCRLAIKFPILPQMQVRAIATAAAELKKQGLDPKPEIMIPLVSVVPELEKLRKLAEATIAEVEAEQGVELDIPVGTMIELPRAAVTADEIATQADFFSFGTNDLTQTTFGFSRDDVEAEFVPQYLAERILPYNPFATVDPGVAKLVEMGVKLGHQGNSDIQCGVCGEHGGDPDSIKTFYKIGLDYVSCSPYRVPLARLGAAQAALADK